MNLYQLFVSLLVPSYIFTNYSSPSRDTKLQELSVLHCGILKSAQLSFLIYTSYTSTVNLIFLQPFILCFFAALEILMSNDNEIHEAFISEGVIDLVAEVFRTETDSRLLVYLQSLPFSYKP